MHNTKKVTKHALLYALFHKTQNRFQKGFLSFYKVLLLKKKKQNKHSVVYCYITYWLNVLTCKNSMHYIGNYNTIIFLHYVIDII